MFNTHFDHRGEQARRQSAKLIAARIKARKHQHEPAILTGDFNAGEDSVAIATLREQGIDATGPHPADTLFAPHKRGTYDVAIAMYHDQALVPIKALDFDEGVNVTLGLPIVRTSPDHGTAFDIAGRGLAEPGAMIAALKMAGEIAARRKHAHAG